MRRYGDHLMGVETDLPALAVTKREMLAMAGLLSERHRVAELNALADGGLQRGLRSSGTLPGR
jgi:hypothetical protein